MPVEDAGSPTEAGVGLVGLAGMLIRVLNISAARHVATDKKGLMV
jgi:hypothetical protein